jgi:hypothetical protein
MPARAVLAVVAAAVLAGLAAEARADLVTAQSVAQVGGGTAVTGDNLFPFSFPQRASELDGLYAIDLDCPSNGTTGTEYILIVYAPGDPAGDLDFVIACGSDTAFMRLTRLDFFNALDFDPSARSGESGSINLNQVMLADTVTDLHFTAADLTQNGGMQIGDLNGYDSVLAEFTFTQRGSSRLQIDLVANPEPGTLALFALGAAGLGGLAWRRRRGRAAAK